MHYSIIEITQWKNMSGCKTSDMVWLDVRQSLTDKLPSLSLVLCPFSWSRYPAAPSLEPNRVFPVLRAWLMWTISCCVLHLRELWTIPLTVFSVHVWNQLKILSSLFIKVYVHEEKDFKCYLWFFLKNFFNLFIYFLNWEPVKKRWWSEMQSTPRFFWHSSW